MLHYVDGNLVFLTVDSIGRRYIDCLKKYESRIRAPVQNIVTSSKSAREPEVIAIKKGYVSARGEFCTSIAGKARTTVFRAEYFSPVRHPKA